MDHFNSSPPSDGQGLPPLACYRWLVIITPSARSALSGGYLNGARNVGQFFLMADQGGASIGPILERRARAMRSGDESTAGSPPARSATPAHPTRPPPFPQGWNTNLRARRARSAGGLGRVLARGNGYPVQVTSSTRIAAASASATTPTPANIATA